MYHLSREKSVRKLVFLGCAFFLTWSAGDYFGNFSNEAESLVSWHTQMDHVNDTDNLYLVTNDGEYYSYRTFLAQDVSFNTSEGVTLSDVSREGTEASFSYQKPEGTDNAYVEVSFNYYPYYRAHDEDGNELSTGITDMLRLRVLLPESSSGTVHVSFEIPGLWRIGDVVSLLTLCALITLAVLSRRKRKED